MFKNKWKLSFLVSVLLFIVSNVFWLYSVVDQAVSNSYLSDSNNQANRSVKVLGELIVKGSGKYTKKDILHLLRQTNPDGFIVEKENEVTIGFLIFTFKNDKLISVE